MKSIDNVLNNLYCLSQGATSTIINLRAYPHIFKNPNSHRLFQLFKELHLDILDVYKYIQLENSEENLDIYLSKISVKTTVIEETYEALISTISLPSDHILVKKLRLQVNNILSTVKTFKKTLSNSSVFNKSKSMTY